MGIPKNICQPFGAIPFAIFLMFTPAFAASWTVGPSGNFTTIQAALNSTSVVDGDTITVQPGTYVENIRFYGKAVTLTSVDPNHPENYIIDGHLKTLADPNYDVGSTILLRDHETPTTIIEGFTIKSGTGTSGLGGGNRFGGGVACLGSGATFRKCAIENNQTNYYGGGMYIENFAQVYLENCTIRNNITTKRGGGIYVTNGTLNLTDCLLEHNTNSTENGGGLYTKNSTLVVDRCQISNNAALRGAGIYFYDGGNMAFSNSLMAGNNATSTGGAIYLYSGADPTLIHCTLANNHATTEGAAVYCTGASNPIFRNCIFWRNDPNATQFVRNSGAPALYFCDIQGGWTGTGGHNINKDPNFVRPDPNYLQNQGDYHLTLGSVCYDSDDPNDGGDPNFVPLVDQTDLDGNPRFSGFEVDMGCYEYDPNERVHNVNTDLWYNTLQGAVDAATTGDTLQVAPDRRYETILINDKHLTIESLDPNSSAFVNATIIDGSQGTDPIFDCVNNPGTVLDGLTITHGYDGGVDALDSQVTVRKCRILENNVQTGFGGGVACDGGTMTLDRCLLAGNSADTGGGAWCQDAGMTLINCALAENTAEFEGGGIAAINGDINLTFCTLRDNLEEGLYADADSTVAMNTCTLWNSEGSHPAITAMGTVTAQFSNIEGGWPGENNINEAPLYTLSSEYDYRISRESPCINRGDYALTTIPYDLDGQTRRVHCQPDMGAWEVPDPNALEIPQSILRGTTRYCTLQEALDAGGTNKVITLNPGLYFANVHVTDPNLTITSTEPNSPELTIIDGSLKTLPVFDCNDINLTIEGIKITQGTTGVKSLTGNLTLRRSLLVGNHGSFGGGLSFENGVLTLDRCLIAGNTSASGGGGLWVKDAQAALTNCALATNTASLEGGGIAAYNTDVDLTFCTLRNNDPNGIYLDADSTLDVDSSILWDNFPIARMTGAEVTADFSDIQGGWDGTDNLNTDPLFVITDTSSYQISTLSPCINLANYDLTAISYDLNHQPRRAYCRGDMGAWEVQTPTGSQLPQVIWRDTHWYCGLQNALDADSTENTITLGRGHYYTNALVADPNLTITAYDPNTPELTTLDASKPVDPNHTYAIMLQPNKAPNLTLQGLTMLGGGGYRNSTEGYKGGAIFASQTSGLTISQCRIMHNTADHGGGIYLSDANDTQIRHCTLTNNLSRTDAGGIQLRNSDNVSLDNCLISGNTTLTGSGTGIQSRASQNLTLSFCTLTGNRLWQTSESIATFHLTENASGQLENSILYDANTPAEIILDSGCSLAASYSDIKGGFPGIGNLDVNPNFAQPGSWDLNNTPDNPLDDTWELADQHLTTGSACINQGNPQFIPALDQTDLDGHLRFSGLGIDMGCYEFDPNQRVLNYRENHWYARLQTAIDQAQTGDTLYIAPARLLETVHIDGKDLNIRCLDPNIAAFRNTTILDGHQNGHPVFDCLNTNTTITGLLITGGSTGYGGGINCQNGRLDLRLCELMENHADFGGGLACQDGTVQLDRCLIAGNTAATGGGLWCQDANMILNNCATVENTATIEGGGIAAIKGNIDLIFCTLRDNTKDGIRIDAESALYVDSSILWDNTPGQITTSNASGVYTQFSDIQGGWDGFENINTPPQWLTTDTYSYQINNASPCVNLANYELTNIPYDLAGQPRSARCRADMGAWEVQSPTGIHLPQVIERGDHGYCSMQEALDTSDPNTIITLNQGYYLANMRIGQSNLTITSAYPNHPELTIVDASQPEDPNHTYAIMLLPNQTSHVTIQGLTLVGGKGYRDGSDGFKGGAIFAPQTHDLIVSQCHIVYNTADFGGGIYLYQAHNTLIEKSVLTNNLSSFVGGSLRIYDCNDVRLDHCLITGNTSLLGSGSAIHLQNSQRFSMDFCTATGNRMWLANLDPNHAASIHLTEDSDGLLSNSILFDDTPKEIISDPPSTVTSMYCNIKGGYPGLGNLNVNPRFVSLGQWYLNETPGNPLDDFWQEGNYRLRNTINLSDFAHLASYWLQSVPPGNSSDFNHDGMVDLPDLILFSEQFLTPANRCIDAGNPGVAPLLEPNTPTNLRVDMGVYGQTAEAPIPPANWAVLSDTNNDGVSNLIDWGFFSSQWLIEEPNNPGDFNRDGAVGIPDLVIAIEGWLNTTVWR